MITINFCNRCANLFMIPLEVTDNQNHTRFVCPECYCKKWKKLSDLPKLKAK